jgi:hypothetical protein
VAHSPEHHGVVIADGLYCSFVMLALLLARSQRP